MMEGNNHDNIWESPSSASDNENMHNSDNTKDFQHVRWTAIALTHVEYPKGAINIHSAVNTHTSTHTAHPKIK